MLNELLAIPCQREDAWEAAPVSALEEQLTAIRDAIDTPPKTTVTAAVRTRLGRFIRDLSDSQIDGTLVLVGFLVASLAETAVPAFGGAS